MINWLSVVLIAGALSVTNAIGHPNDSSFSPNGSFAVAQPAVEYEVDPDLGNSVYLNEFPALSPIVFDISETYDMVHDLKGQRKRTKKNGEFVLIERDEVSEDDYSSREETSRMIEGMYGCQLTVSQSFASSRGREGANVPKPAINLAAERLENLCLAEPNSKAPLQKFRSHKRNKPSSSDLWSTNELTTDFNVPLLSPSHFLPDKSPVVEALPIYTCLEHEDSEVEISDSTDPGSYLIVNPAPKASGLRGIFSFVRPH